MCGICGHPSAPPAWTETGIVDSAQARIRSRTRRMQMLTRLLSVEAMCVRGDPISPTLTVAAADGRCRVVSGPAEVWAGAESLIGRSIDPLDPALLTRLTSSTTAGSRG